MTNPSRSAARASAGVSPSARSDTSTWLRSNSRRTSASRSSAALARSRATPTSHEITSDSARKPRKAPRYSGRSRSNVPYGGRKPTLNRAEDTIAATTPGQTPPSHEAATTGTRNRNASSVCVRSARIGSMRAASTPARPWRPGRPPARATRCGDTQSSVRRHGGSFHGRHDSPLLTVPLSTAPSVGAMHPMSIPRPADDRPVPAQRSAAARDRVRGQARCPRPGAPHRQPGARTPRQGRGPGDLQLRRTVLGRLRHRGDAQDAVHRGRRARSRSPSSCRCRR